jgi:hypothetical protein
MGKHASDIDKAAFLVHLQYLPKWARKKLISSVRQGIFGGVR